MKKVFLPFFLLVAATAFSQNGYEIKVTFKPFINQYIYLGHYFGKTYPIIDSAMLNEKSEAVFKGVKNLPGGIYLIGYPNKAGFFEMLVDKQQHFSVIADTATLANDIKFLQSPDNTLFREYQKQMGLRGKKIIELRATLNPTTSKSDSVKILDQIEKLDNEINQYREAVIQKNPGTILSTLLVSMREPVLTGGLKNPKNAEDSLTAYQFFKQHYWDGVNFWDGRLAYTTFFDDKIEKYFAQLVVPNPDSIIKEIDWMLGFASPSEEMTRFLLIKFVNRYLNQKYMFEDAVFVHLFEKYFAQKNYSWLNEAGKKTITDRAYSLMANLMGSPAADIELPDSAGTITRLYASESNFTIVAFWDPTCGHCKEVLPKLDSMYQSKWKAMGLKIFAVAKETDGTKKDWLQFIRDHHIGNWINVYYSKADDKARIDNNIPGYSQLYDIQSFPTLYLLDKDKRIIAKKLTFEQIDEVLQLKTKDR